MTAQLRICIDVPDLEKGIAFYTRTKAITTRWPATNAVSAGFHMPAAG